MTRDPRYTAFRKEIYANLDNAFHNNDKFQNNNGKYIPWKKADALSLAVDMLDKTDLTERYHFATVDGVMAIVRNWIDTLP